MRIGLLCRGVLAEVAGVFCPWLLVFMTRSVCGASLVCYGCGLLPLDVCKGLFYSEGRDTNACVGCAAARGCTFGSWHMIVCWPHCMRRTSTAFLSSASHTPDIICLYTFLLQQRAELLPHGG
jgi:hypothetical protein